jgi:hypothetical protein
MVMDLALENGRIAGTALYLQLKFKKHHLMAKNFDLEQWQFADMPEQPKTYELKDINFKKLKRELSLHEASHFVFDCLLLKHFSVFTKINFAIICPERMDEGGWNVVNGTAPNIPIERMHDYFLKKFYIEEKARAIAKIFSFLAGYTSYLIFIEDNDFFINIPNEDKTKLFYFDIKNVPIHRCSDIEKTLRYLSYMDIQKHDEKIVKIKEYINEVKNLMKIEAIRNSIIFVGRKLYNNACQRIEGNELDKIVKEVQRLTNKVPFKEILQRCED